MALPALEVQVVLPALEEVEETQQIAVVAARAGQVVIQVAPLAILVVFSPKALVVLAEVPEEVLEGVEVLKTWVSVPLHQAVGPAVVEEVVVLQVEQEIPVPPV